MAGKHVDVLAVMGEAACSFDNIRFERRAVDGQDAYWTGRIVNLHEALAAVSELIESGSALADAQVKFDLYGGDADECSAAWERHAAALARATQPLPPQSEEV